jgi:hypothetical protein
MKHVINSCLLLLLLGQAFGQTKPAVHPLVDSLYQQWFNNRTDSLRGTPWDTFYYIRQVPPDLLDDLKEAVSENRTITQLKRAGFLHFADTTNAEHISITQPEVDYLLSQLDFIKPMVWPEGLFVRGKAVDMKVVDSMRYRMNWGNESIEKTFPYQHHLFTVPILFRNNTLCIFFNAEADVLDTTGELWLYRKENNRWVPFGRMSIWSDMMSQPIHIRQ